MNNIKVRSVENEAVYLEGYGAVFNQKSRLIWEDGKYFYEIIKENAFDDVLRSEDLNVKAVVNHDETKLLGRTKSGTLSLETDEKGLKYSVRMGNTQLHKDTLEMVERGDLSESSFKFRVKKGDSVFQRDDNGDLLHIVSRVSGLYDVSLVNDGAFANTDVTIRSMIADFEAEESKERLQKIKSENQERRNYLQTLKDSK